MDLVSSGRTILLTIMIEAFSSNYLYFLSLLYFMHHTTFSYLCGGGQLKHDSNWDQQISGFRFSTLQSSNDENNISSPTDIKNEEHSDKQGMRSRLRQSMTKAGRKVQRLVAGGSSTVVSKGGSPIAGVLTDAAVNAANMAKEEVRTAARDVIQRAYGGIGVNKDAENDIETQARIEGDTQIAMDAISLAKTTVADAFEAAESAIRLAEEELQRAKAELEAAKRDAALGLAAAEKAASDAARKARRATDHAWVEQLKAGTDETEFVDEIDENMDSPINEDNSTIYSGGNDMSGEVSSLTSETQEQRDGATVETDEEFDNPAIIADVWSDFDISSLRYEDVDYTLTDMAPPFINEDECLIPGEPVVRVEKAPQNSRRIFAGIDIPVSVDDVWNVSCPRLRRVSFHVPCCNRSNAVSSPIHFLTSYHYSSIDQSISCQTNQNSTKTNR